MRSLDEMSTKETVALLNKCWMTHDGMWFFHCLNTFGIEATNKLNKEAIRSLSSVEINRLKQVLGINGPLDRCDDFLTFFKEASTVMIPDFMQVRFGYPGGNILTWAFPQGECFAYKGVKRLGVIDRYECGVLYRIKCWLDELGIAHRFNPECGLCLMHHHGSCAGEIRLFV
ncbi:DUF6125 family protein [Desulfoluna butyratoxydans]|uniref:Uncharacterized protein n=1 Tax=Desulfoluna butyratoxydans TaxID=231438 RepID=A0A4U8YN12_9BACT|nr:DUF6125 family protein [Desulfoluna butyratoxydans]VFQ45446.1 hypothetical protein MSL71_31030 [Desulfoluna butyratoxydans]